MSENSHDIGSKLSFLNQQKQIDDEEDSNFLSNLDFIKFLIVAKRNIIWVVFFFGLSALVAYLFLRYTEPVFESSALLKLEVQAKSDVLGVSNKASNLYATNDLSGEIELIRSPLVISQVARAMHMDVLYFAKGKILSEERYQSSPFALSEYTVYSDEVYGQNIKMEILDTNRYQLTYVYAGSTYEKEFLFDEEIEIPLFKTQIVRTAFFGTTQSHSLYYFKINSLAWQIQQLAANLSVEIINPDAGTLAIVCKNNHPVKAKDIVLAFDSVYTKEGLQNKYRSSEQTIRYLIDHIKANEEQMDLYERQIQNFLIRNKSLDLKGDVLKNIQEVERIDKDIVQYRQVLNGINEVFDLVSVNKFQDDIMLPTIDVPNLAALRDLIAQYNTLRKEHDILMVSNRENTTVIRLNELDMNNLRKRIFKIIEAEKTKVLNILFELTKRKQKIEEMIYTATPKDNELKKIQRLYNFYERLYLMAFDKKIEFEMLKASTVPNFRVLSEPIVSKTPIYPVAVSVYTYALVVGFAISFIWVVIQYFLHNTIDNVGELEKSTLAPILGFIPRFTRTRLVHSMLVIDKSPKGAISEALRTIRTNIEFLFPKKDLKTISMTSTISGEGKTFVSINLAGVIAFSGKKVLVIDMDMRRPKIHTAFNDPNTAGMSTILIGQTEWRSCLRNTSIETLKFITSGPIPPNPSELIISDYFEDVLEEFKKEFDIVIIDSPPAGLVTDGVLIMKKVDLPIYVVRAEYSKKGFEKNINRLITKNDFKKLCVVLNDFSNLSGYGYGYKYGYGYGYGYYSSASSDTWVQRLTKRISNLMQK